MLAAVSQVDLAARPDHLNIAKTPTTPAQDPQAPPSAASSGQIILSDLRRSSSPCSPSSPPANPTATSSPPSPRDHASSPRSSQPRPPRTAQWLGIWPKGVKPSSPRPSPPLDARGPHLLLLWFLGSLKSAPSLVRPQLRVLSYSLWCWCMRGAGDRRCHA